MIHKKILDVAASRPDASMETIADDVSGATATIVEQVLEEYGDPGEMNSNGDDSTGDPDTDERQDTLASDSIDTEHVSVSDEAESTMSEHESRHDARLELPFEPEDVTEKQLETLVEIYERPDATQAALADTLGVSSATISQRVNAIDEFSWSNRREFVEVLFDDGAWFEGNGKTDDETEQTDSKPDSDLVADGTSTEKTVIDRNEADNEAAVGRPDSSDLGEAESGGGENTVRTESTDESTVGATESVGSRDPTPKSHTDGGVDAVDQPTESDTSEMHRAGSESVEELSEQLEAVTKRLESVERQLEDDPSSCTGVPFDPELAHKVIHACLTADHINEEEELSLLKAMMASDSSET